jgi:hypothetical protein
MARAQQLARTLLIAALVLGLNALGILSAMHGRHPSHSRANVSHGHHGSSRRASRNGGNYADEAHAIDAHDAHTDSQVTQKPHKASHAAPLFAVLTLSPMLFAPEFIDAPLANVDEVARGSAARAPGAARAPPLS